MALPPLPPVQSLYVHVPFCARKCAYCAFYSEAASGELIDRYRRALERELEQAAPRLQPRTVFFGGGTPTLLNLQQWERILNTFDRLGLLGADEWTVECNPATLSPDKAQLLRDHGVNRISLGVQSLDERLLDRLGRVHTRDMVFRSYDLLRAAGFDNLNLDLMFAIPGQTLAVWQDTLGEAMAMGSEHLSCYEVIYEEDTPLFQQLQAGEFAVDEDLACAMYETLQDSAEQAGLRQYEVANFARDSRSAVAAGPTNGTTTPPASWLALTPSLSPGERVPAPSSGASAKEDRAGEGIRAVQGFAARNQVSENPPPPHSLSPFSHPSLPAFACRHNLNYWRGGAFHGLGPSATSYVDGVRWKNCANTERYCQALESGASPLEFREQLPSVARAGETAAFGLRLVAGWGFEEFRSITGSDLREGWRTEIENLCRRGWGELTTDGFRLTRHGLRFADAAAEMFLR